MNPGLWWGAVVLSAAAAVMPDRAMAESGMARAVRHSTTIIPNGSIDPNFTAGSVTFNGTSASGKPEVTRIGNMWDAESPVRDRRLVEQWSSRVGGHDLPFDRKSRLPPLSIMKAAGVALKALPAVAVGIELWELFDETRVRPGTCAEGGLPSSVSDVLCLDAGVPPEGGGTVKQWQCSTYCGGVESPVGWHDTLEQMCAAREGVAGGKEYANCVITSYEHGTFTLQYRTVGFTSWNTYWGTSISRVVPAPEECPASVDFENPENSLPAGLPIGPDGKCRTGRYTTPIAPSVAAQRVEDLAPADAPALQRIAEDVLARDVPIEDIVPEGISGPSSRPGTPSVTTTTTDAGTTVVESVPTTHYTYEGDTINYYVTTVTTTTVNGVVTSVETDEKPADESDQCKDNPDSLGCSKMGTPGSESPTWGTRTVELSPESLGFGAGCPAPVTWSVFGLTLTWSYAPVCDVAPVIRLALLAFAGLGSIGIIIRETAS